MSIFGRRPLRSRISLLIGSLLITSSLIVPAVAQAVVPDGSPNTLIATLDSPAGPQTGTFNVTLDMDAQTACYVADISGLDFVATPLHSVVIRRSGVETVIIFSPPSAGAPGHFAACADSTVPDALMQAIFNHAGDYKALFYVEASPTDVYVAIGGTLRYQYDTVNVDITTKLCPVAIQTPGALVGKEGTCTTASLPGFDYRVTDSKRLDAKIADAVLSSGAYSYRNVAKGAVTIDNLSVPTGYRVGTASASETLSGTDPWTFTANGNETVTVYLFREPTAPPIVTSPVAGIRKGVAYGPAAVRVLWTGTDMARIVKFTLQRSRDGLAYETIYTGMATSFDTTMSSGHSYRFRVEATDVEDQTSGWKYSTTDTLRAIQNTSSRIAYGGAWVLSTSSNASGGSTHKASLAGKTASLSFRGRAVAWVAPQSLTRGQAKIYIDGVYKATIDLGGASASRIVQYTRTWSSIGNHRITIKVVGTSGRPRVDLDAFLYID